jgi:hypothetical protein
MVVQAYIKLDCGFSVDSVVMWVATDVSEVPAQVPAKHLPPPKPTQYIDEQHDQIFTLVETTNFDVSIATMCNTIAGRRSN